MRQYNPCAPFGRIALSLDDPRCNQEWKLESALSQGIDQELGIRKIVGSYGINYNKRRTAIKLTIA